MMVKLSIQGGSYGTFDLKDLISALQNSHKLYDMDYFVFFSFRTLETSHEICNDFQMYNTII